jgi:hypothetical protein
VTGERWVSEVGDRWMSLTPSITFTIAFTLTLSFLLTLSHSPSRCTFSKSAFPAFCTPLHHLWQWRQLPDW